MDQHCVGRQKMLMTRTALILCGDVRDLRRRREIAGRQEQTDVSGEKRRIFVSSETRRKTIAEDPCEVSSMVFSVLRLRCLLGPC